LKKRTQFRVLAVFDQDRRGVRVTAEDANELSSAIAAVADDPHANWIIIRHNE
jgi:hypothetical protein